MNTTSSNKREKKHLNEGNRERCKRKKLLTHYQYRNLLIKSKINKNKSNEVTDPRKKLDEGTGPRKNIQIKETGPENIL